MTPFKLAKLSLIRHRLSTVISVCAIGLGIAVCGILLRLHEVSESRFSVLGHGGDAIVGAKAGGIEIVLNALNAEGPYPDFLPYALFESLKAKQQVQHGDGSRTAPTYISSITPFIYFGKYEDYRLIGTDESFFNQSDSKHQINFASGGWSNRHNQIVLGSTIAQDKQLSIGDTIRVQPWLEEETSKEDINFEISGILESTGTTWDRTLYSRVETAHSILKANIDTVSQKSIWGKNVLHLFLVRLRPGSFTAFEELINKRTVGQLIDIEQQKGRLKQLSGVGEKLGFLVTIFVLFLGGLSITAMLVTRFEGMSLQLAVLRAVGYTKAEISKSLAWEGLLLGVLGVLTGAIIDFCTFPLVRGLLGDALPPSNIVSSSLFESSIIWVIAIFATMLSVFIPMIKIARQDAHVLLRGM